MVTHLPVFCARPEANGLVTLAYFSQSKPIRELGRTIRNVGCNMLHALTVTSASSQSLVRLLNHRLSDYQPITEPSPL